MTQLIPPPKGAAIPRLGTAEIARDVVMELGELSYGDLQRHVKRLSRYPGFEGNMELTGRPDSFAMRVRDVVYRREGSSASLSLVDGEDGPVKELAAYDSASKQFVHVAPKVQYQDLRFHVDMALIRLYVTHW